MLHDKVAGTQAIKGHYFSCSDGLRLIEADFRFEPLEYIAHALLNDATRLLSPEC